jgi:hypothetical protein
MILGIGFLQPGDLPFETTAPLLGLLDGMESPFEPCHPAGECGTLPLQAGAELLEPELASDIGSGGSGRANDAAAWGGHVQAPSMIWSLMLPS